MMANYKLFNLLIHFYLCVVNVSSVYIENNAYKGITISISESVQKQEFSIETLKAVLTKSSEFIYHATRKRSYFGEFIVSLPSSWTAQVCKNDDFTTEISQRIDVYLTNSDQKRHLTTKHSRGCGLEGDRIDMPLEWLNENNVASLARQFAQHWSIYRYGVFEEKTIIQDSCYLSGKSWTPVGCYNIKPQSEPTFEEGLPICSLPSDFFETSELKSSLMSDANSSKALDFCDGFSFPHNPAMPTFHNTLCKGRTVWSVIENSPDFKYGMNLPLKTNNPPKSPVFKCFKEVSVHVTLAIQTNTIELIPFKVMKQMRAVLYEFLGNMVPENSKVTLVTFSDKEDSSAPFDIDIKNSKKLNQQLLSHVKVTRIINNTCLSCGFQKALNITQYSSFSSPIVVVIAWKSAVIDENPSMLINSIKEFSPSVRLHLILVEDTTTKEIPTDIIQAIRSQNGLIYFLPQELVFRASKLLGILAAVVKNPMEVEDKIVVVHKKQYLDISQNFVDSFTIPSGKFYKMLYIMYCSNNDKSVIQSGNSECTSLSELSDTDETFKCGELWNFNDKKEKKIWEYPFSYSESPTPLHCSSIAMLLSSPSKDSFTLKGWLSEYVIKVPRNALTIYIEIVGSSKHKFNVTAQISGPGLTSPALLELRDNGNGDPDTKAGDGIYSRYFTKFSEKGIYIVTASAEHLVNNADSFFVGEKRNQGGKLVQSKTIGFFYVSDTIPKLDTLPPNRVADLRIASINHDNRTAVLQWTAPGGDYDEGKAKEYEVYYTEDWKYLQDSMLSKIPTNMLKYNDMRSPKPSGQPERVTFQFPVGQEKNVYYIALRAIDITGNRGQLSNIVQIVIGIEKRPTTNTTHLNNTGDGTETSTHSIHQEDEDFSRCYIILGGAIGVLLIIIIINIIIWLVCLQKYKKRWKEIQDNSQQSVAPLQSKTDIKENISEVASTNPHSYTNPIMEDYTMPRESNGIRENASFHQPATYAYVTKKDRRCEERDGYPLRRVDNINVGQDHPRHRERDLGLV
ncbi:calcium-activated chloride channel regulator 1-like isoform X2 [Argiope bruennichi]|uniref:calcium-activated chloride channel regulator 1-like isoform X2 n=1 Tax=Argiope bruennichi TaxID=94029 RepID=UPI002493F26D|nr:calcium-activated chloride channel regulator 1-like isoform X2 [Argiope bruennichi]